MNKFIFSGAITKRMADILKRAPGFEPIDVLVSQLDRPACKRMIDHIEAGLVKSLFIDSGAYSLHTGRVASIDVDEYIDYVNSMDEYIYAFAQVDKLPGTMYKPREPQDFIDSANESWENYLYMRQRVKSPHKLVYVYHHGEPVSALQRALDYVDTSVPNTTSYCEHLGTVYNNRLNLLGLGSANDTSVQTRERYISSCYHIIKNSNYPDIKVHLFGTTIMPFLAKFPCFSADSLGHRLRGAANKIYTDRWGNLSLSRSRSSGTRSAQSFLDAADTLTLQEFEEYIKPYGVTVEQLFGDFQTRAAIDMLELQKSIRGKYSYNPEIHKTPKPLFKLEQ